MKSLNFTLLLIILLASSCNSKNTDQSKIQQKQEETEVTIDNSINLNSDTPDIVCEVSTQEISVFDQSCLDGDQEYVKAAFRGVVKKIGESLTSITSLEETAQNDKNQYLEKLNELKNEIINDQENKTLTDSKKNKYNTALMIIGEDIAIGTRHVSNELANASLVGKSLEQLLPYLKNELELIEIELGYISIEELEKTKSFLISLGNNSTDRVMESELAFAHYQIASDELDTLIEILSH